MSHTTRVVSAMFVTRVKAQEAEIRCYRMAGETFTYEVFFMLDDGTSWSSGALGSWEQALATARRRALRYDSARMFADQHQLSAKTRRS